MVYFCNQRAYANNLTDAVDRFLSTPVPMHGGLICIALSVTGPKLRLDKKSLDKKSLDHNSFRLDKKSLDHNSFQTRDNGVYVALQVIT